MENTLLQDHENHDLCNCKEDLQFTTPQNSLSNLIKHSLLLGAEKLLMSRNSPALLTTFLPPHQDYDDDDDDEENEDMKYIPRNNNSAACISTLANFPFDIVDFFTVMALDFVGFQIRLFFRFLIFPVRVFHFWLALLMFPFRTLTRIRDDVKKGMMRACGALYARVASFVWNRVNSPRSVMKMAIRFGKGLFCSFYVFLVLVGLLVLAFLASGVVMRNLTEEPILRTENLNFDYTKTSPFALVKLASSPEESLLKRTIPFDHKMQLTISFTLPESDYNRKLGIFQVRVESLSANGKATFGSSYPTMLRFKSQPIRFAESLFKSVPLITGFQSEVQYLKIVIGEFAEGHEPTSSFKVILEPRAEFKAGSGVPEIYSASMDIKSRLPPLKRIVWSWRRTVFVWIGFTVFVFEMMFVLLLCRPFILPGLGKFSKKKTN
ncbi:hypothetical protein ABFX02_13G063900 [Erythranthe guttata]